MTVIDTKPAALPVRALRWAWTTLADFWCDVPRLVRAEIDAWRRP